MKRRILLIVLAALVAGAADLPAAPVSDHAIQTAATPKHGKKHPKKHGKKHGKRKRPRPPPGPPQT